MHSVELNLLSQPLSNEARILYLLVLRPAAHQITGISAAVNFKQIKTLLNQGGANINLGREINELLLELIETGLVERLPGQDTDKSLNGRQFRLPALQPMKNTEQLHTKFALTTDWTPLPATFENIAQLTGLLQKEFSTEELGDFVVYWMGRPDQYFSDWQWTQKFIQHLRKNRQIKGYNPTSVVGYQQTTTESEVVIDENTRKLIDKYHGKSDG